MINLKKIPYLALIVFFTLPAWAQETEPALARVHYEFFHINDTLQPEKPTREEMVLYLGQSSTLYGSFEFDRIVKNIENQLKAPGFDGNLTIMTQRNATPSSYYTALHQEKLTQVYHSHGVNYLLEEDYPSIEWSVSDETKEVGGYPVQKATGQFGGREYVVWFTTELPFQGGPWKLQGLPGVILEAASKDGDVQFSYAGLETDIVEKGEIGIPEDVVKTTPAALERLREAIRRNPEAARSARSAANASSGSGGTTGGVISISRGGNPMSALAVEASAIKSIRVHKDLSEVSAVVNNPLEIKR